MRTTRDGKVMCELRDPTGTGPVLYVNPALYTVIRRVLEGRMTCMVDLNFNDGSLGNTHVRMDGERLAKALEPSAILQAG